MVKRNADPNDFQEILQTAHEGDHIVLAPGEYKGPFAVEKPVTITGQGKSTILWSGDEPCLVCKCSGIKMGNLALSRTVVTLDDVVVVTEPQFQTTFENVTIQKGRAEGVCWTPMEWRVSHHDFGEIQQGYTIEKQISIQVAQKCRISTDVPWLRFDRTTLYPGEHNIRTEITAGNDCVPGDKLTVEVQLLDERGGELACFDVAAAVTSVTFNLHPSHGTGSSDGKKIYQDKVSIRFSNTAARKMADILLDEDDQETSDRESAAKDRFYDTFGSQSHLWLIRRRKADRSDEVKCTFTLAARKENGSAVASMGSGHPLQLLALMDEEQGTPFFVLDVYRSRFDTQGDPDGYTILAQLQLTRPSPYRSGEISEPLYEAIQNLLPAGTLIPTEHQQALWQNYLQIEKKIAEKSRFAVPVEETNFGAGGHRISFRVAPDRAFTPSDPKAAEPMVFWEKVANCRNDRLSWKASLDAEDQGEDIGTLTGFQKPKNKLQVKLNEETAERCLSGQWSPTAGSLLCYNAKGSLSEIKRREKAMKCIQSGQVQNPLLGQFMFDATKARIPKEIVRLESRDLISKQLNGGGDGDATSHGQWGAVQKCLASPDLTLIQGPPGTGKTTVIVELCYQMTRQGKRTLIASQANLAVDNALSRMIFNPSMRVLRIGKPESVEDEGQPYLEANVIHKWLVDTAGHCEQRLAQLEQNTGMFQQLLSSETRFVAYLEKQEQRMGLHSERDAVETETGTCKAAWEGVQKQHDEMSGVIDAFALVAEDLGSVDWDAPAVVHLLCAIAAEVREDSICRECHGKFQQLIERVEGDGAFLKGLVPDPPRIFRDVGAIAEQARQLLGSNRTLETRTEGPFQELERYRELLKGIEQKEKHIDGIEKQRQEENARIQILSGQLRLREQLLKNTRRFHGSFRDAPADLLEAIADGLRQLTEQAGAGGSISPAAAVDRLCRSLLPGELNGVAIDQVESNAVADRLEAVFRQMTGLSERIVREDREYKQIMEDLQQLSQKLPATIPGEIPTAPPTFSTFQEIRDAAATLSHAMERAYNPKKIVPSRLSEKFLHLLQGDPKQWLGKWDPEEVARCRGRLASLFTALQKLKSRRRTEQERDKAHCREKAVLLADPIRIMLLKALACIEDRVAQEVQNLKQKRDGTWTRSKKIEQAGKEETARLQSMKDEVAPIHTAAMLTLPAINEIPARLQGPYREVLKSGDPASFRHMLQIDTRRIESIRKAADEINPPALANHIIDTLSNRANTLSRHADQSRQKYLEKAAVLDEVLKKIGDHENDLESEKAWWAATWEAIPKHLHPSARAEDIHSPDFLRRINDRFVSWRKELGRIEQYLKRYQSLVSEWIARLRNPSPQDREELRQEYLNNANVIGVTCSIAGSPDFNREFRDFDMVIVDEVSKATPPELIIPALKGKKVVLIGDHKQLPPMTQDQTIKEVAENAGIEEEEIQSLKESLFKRLFQEAPQEIKETLVTQYRMHEQIMNAVNQFYDEKLVCGIIDSKKERAHHLGGMNFKEDQHLIWVATPQTTKFEEKKKDNSKSYYNPSEIDIIAALCDEFNSLWGEKRKKGEYAPKNLGVITFYKDQEHQIRDKLNPEKYPNLDIRIGTVDRFQGMERDVVIVSLVRNNRNSSRFPEIGFAKEPERVNVAFSRAREMLVIVGCMDLFCRPAADKRTEPYINVAKAVQQAKGYIDADRFLQLPN